MENVFGPQVSGSPRNYGKGHGWKLKPFGDHLTVSDSGSVLFPWGFESGNTKGPRGGYACCRLLQRCHDSRPKNRPVFSLWLSRGVFHTRHESRSSDSVPCGLPSPVRPVGTLKTAGTFEQLNFLISVRTHRRRSVGFGWLGVVSQGSHTRSVGLDGDEEIELARRRSGLVSGVEITSPGSHGGRHGGYCPSPA